MIAPEPLILPPSIHLATAEELVGVPGGAAALARVAGARLTTGYRLDAGGDPRFRAFAEANVHAPKLWEVFAALVGRLLPEKAAAVLGTDGAEPHVTQRSESAAVLAALAEFRGGLTADGFVEFGVIDQVGDATDEVFVPAGKYIQVWTSRPDDVHAVFAEHGIPEVTSLAFVDEYPHITEPTVHGRGIADASAFVQRVLARCVALPPR